MKRYPFECTVSTYRGVAESSPSALRRRSTAWLSAVPAAAFVGDEGLVDQVALVVNGVEVELDLPVDPEPGLVDGAVAVLVQAVIADRLAQRRSPAVTGTVAPVLAGIATLVGCGIGAGSTTTVVGLETGAAPEPDSSYKMIVNHRGHRIILTRSGFVAKPAEKVGQAPRARDR